MSARGAADVYAARGTRRRRPRTADRWGDSEHRDATPSSRQRGAGTREREAVTRRNAQGRSGVDLVEWSAAP
jgi:hypothetical protein